MAAKNERVVAIRKSKSLTQKGFSDAIGFSRSSLSEIESGSRCLNLGLVEAIRAAFPDINIDWLLTGEGSMLKTKTESNNRANFDEEDIRLLNMIKRLPEPQKNKEVADIEAFLRSFDEAISHWVANNQNSQDRRQAA